MTIKFAPSLDISNAMYATKLILVKGLLQTNKFQQTAATLVDYGDCSFVECTLGLIDLIVAST